MTRRWLTILSALALVVLGAALGLSRFAGSSVTTTEHPVAIPETARTVLVSTAMPAPSESSRRLSAMVVEGNMPTARTVAQVVSDTECTPDAQMISRCRNEMRLPDGSMLVLRHPHDMRHVPCLAPGENVMLVPSSV